MSPGGGISSGTATGASSTWKPWGTSTASGGGASAGGGGGGGTTASTATSRIISSSSSSASTPEASVAQTRPAAIAVWNAREAAIDAALPLRSLSGSLANSCICPS